MENLTKRQNLILDMLQGPEGYLVSDMSKILDVSVVTVRSELRELEKLGMVYRSHGKVFNNLFIPMQFRFKKNLKEKTAVAKLAAQIVENEKSIMISHGSTCSLVSNYINPKEKKRIVTNSTIVLDVTKNKKNIDIILIGGMFYPTLDATLGAVAMSQIENYFVDTLFVGADGVSLDFGISTDFEDNTQILRKMAAQARRTILLVDSSKVNKKGLYRILDLKELDMMIIDSGCPQSFIDSIKEKGVDVKIVDI